MSQLARIFQPTKTAMQSGRATTKRWALEFEPSAQKTIDPLMGWTSSPDTDNQVRLYFEERDEAVAFAKKHAMTYVVLQPRERRVRPKSYADNFKWNRVR